MIVKILLLLLIVMTIIYLRKGVESFESHTKPFIWLYWENKPGIYEPPNYIKLCHETVKKHCSKNFNVVILDEIDVHYYLKNLRKDIDKLLIPQKVDYIRLKLLQKYGGIWLDSDIIVMKDLMPIIDKMNGNKDFVGFGCHYRFCNSTGKPRPANWVMGSKKDTKFINMCVKKCDKLLDSKKKLKYFDLGRTLLWECIKKMKNEDPSWDYYHYDSKCLDRDSKYKKIRNNRLISEENIDENCLSKSLFVPIYNTAPGFPEWFKTMSKNEIFEKDMLISKLFRKSLR